MKRALILMVGALALSVSAPASAADMAARPYVKAPPPAVAVYNWTGFYIGGHVGYGWGHSANDAFNAAGVLLDSTVTNPDGIFGGGQIGFNWQVAPNWLIGVEADGSVSDINSTSTNCSATGCARAFGKLEDFGTVRGRVGYVFNNFLLYGTGGWAWNHSNVDRTITCVVAGGGICPGGPSPSPLTGAVASVSNNNSGWVAGAGIEWMFAPNWTAKVEYQHLQFDNVTRDYGYPGFPAASRRVVSDVHFDTVRVGVNYIFGGPALARY